MSGTSRLSLTPRLPVSRESMDRRPPRLIANDFSTPILSNGVAKSEPLSDSALVLRERELRDREERLRRREFVVLGTSLVLIMPAMKLNLSGLH